MRKVLVNLTRLGDLLQTQPVIAALSEQGHEVCLVCLENFAGAAALLHGVDRVSPLPGAALLAGVERSWPSALARLDSWVEELRRGFDPQEALNLTASPGARLLTRLLAGSSAAQAGFGMDEMGFGLSGNAWATYVQAATLNRGCSPFNLVDGFRAMAGTAGIAPRPELKKPAPLTGLPVLEGGRGYVALQLGASEERRRWPVRFFAAVGARLWREAGLLPLLLGSAAESRLAREYAEHADGTPFADLTGATDLTQLAGALCASRLLITNDTGTMHLAAGLNVPVLALFLATAQPWDTGPYIEGACSLEPDLPCHPCGFGSTCPRGEICRESVKPGLVATLALSFLSRGQWQADEGQGGARIWISCRQPGDTQAFLDLAPLHSGAAWAVDDRYAWIRQQRNFYRQFFDELSGAPLAPKLPAPALSPAMEGRLGGQLERVAALAHLLSQQGLLLQTAARQGAGQAFLQSSHKLSALLAESPELSVLSHVWKAALQDLGGDLPGLGKFLRILRARVTALREDIRGSGPC